MSDTLVELPIYDVFSNGITILGADNSTVLSGVKYTVCYSREEVLSGKGILFNSKRRRVSYGNGSLVIRSRFWRKTIRVRHILSCTRFAYTLVIETSKFRSIRLVFENLSDASAIEKVLSLS